MIPEDILEFMLGVGIGMGIVLVFYLQTRWAEKRMKEMKNDRD